MNTIDSILTTARTQSTTGMTDIPSLLLRLGPAIFFGVALSLVYSAVHRDDAMKGSFVRTLVIMPLVAASITMVIDNNIVRAFGLIGAVALVRFRTVIKDTFDMAFIFLSITIGMAAGTTLYWLAGTSLLLFAATLAVLEMINYGKGTHINHGFKVTFVTENMDAAARAVKHHLDDIVVSSDVKTIEKKNKSKVTYEMVLEHGATHQDLLDRVLLIRDDAISRIKVKKA